MSNHVLRLEDYRARATTLRSRPDIISIESTNFCNLQCIMCPRGEPDIMTRSLGSMDDELFRKICAWDVWHDPVWFHLFGEPLMHPRLFEQIEIAKAAGIPNLAISTNATILTEERAARLVDSPIDTVILAVDGHDAPTYEAIRKSPIFGFEEVTENVRRFLQLKLRAWSERKRVPRAIVQMIVMQQTQDQLDAFRAEWLAAGADEVFFKKLGLWGTTDEQFAQYLTAERRAELGAMRKHPCFYLWQGVTVCWDGRVVPCCYDYDASMVMGNLREQTLEEIWNGPAYVELRRKERDRQNDSPLCLSCTEAPGFA